MRSLDAPVVTLGDMDHLLVYGGTELPDMTGGVHVNVLNNLWGTAFPQWYDSDGLFRFHVALEFGGG